MLDDSDVDNDYIQPIDEENDENLVEEQGLLRQRDSAESRQPVVVCRQVFFKYFIHYKPNCHTDKLINRYSCYFLLLLTEYTVIIKTIRTNKCRASVLSIDIAPEQRHKG